MFMLVLPVSSEQAKQPVYPLLLCSRIDKKNNNRHWIEVWLLRVWILVLSLETVLDKAVKATSLKWHDSNK